MQIVKRVYCPIHGFIGLDQLEYELISSLPFKRLQAIHQMGAGFFVFPCAVHKRYDHSIGVMHVSSLIYDALIQTANVTTVFDESTPSSVYWRRHLRAASLLHDLGHPPFSHLSEEQLFKGGEHHEAWTERIILSSYIAPILKKHGLEPEIIAKLSVGKKFSKAIFSINEGIISQILTGDFFGADRIDYLLRDSYFTGLSYGLIDFMQIIYSLAFVEDEGGLKIGLKRNGIESCQGLLIARHFMFKRIYNYKNVKLYTYYLKEFIGGYYEKSKVLSSVKSFIQTNDYEILAEINRAVFDKHHKLHIQARHLLDQKVDKKKEASLLDLNETVDKKLSMDHYTCENSNFMDISKFDFPLL